MPLRITSHSNLYKLLWLKKGYKGSKKQKRENWTWNGKEKNDLNLDVVEQGDTKQETEADEEVDMITIAELIWEKRDAGVIEEEEEGEKGEEVDSKYFNKSNY